MNQYRLSVSVILVIEDDFLKSEVDFEVLVLMELVEVAVFLVVHDLFPHTLVEVLAVKFHKHYSVLAVVVVDPEKKKRLNKILKDSLEISLPSEVFHSSVKLLFDYELLDSLVVVLVAVILCCSTLAEVLTNSHPFLFLNNKKKHFFSQSLDTQ